MRWTFLKESHSPDDVIYEPRQTGIDTQSFVSSPPVGLAMLDLDQICDDLLRGAWEPVVDRCRGDAPLTARVSREAANLLAVRATDHFDARAPEHASWPAAQDGFRQLSSLEGAEEVRLAGVLFDACIFEPVSGPGTDLRQETVRWLLACIPRRVGRLVAGSQDTDIDPHFLAPVPWGRRISQERFLFNALFGLCGEAGADWLSRLRERSDSWVGSAFQAMCTGQLPLWAADDWSSRLDVLTKTRYEPRPRLVQVFVMAKPPPASAVAQVRLACVYADSQIDQLVRTVAENIRGYRSGDPEQDATLYWWHVPKGQRHVLRWILELSGPPGFRATMVAVASAAGWIDEETRQELTAPLERPAWADEDVPWAPVEIVDAGAVRLPDGLLAGGDPWWSFEGAPFALRLDPGSYAVRRIVASHPLYGRENAAAEVLVDPDAAIARWEPVELEPPLEEGYTVEVGVASFGALEALCPGLGDELPDGIFRSSAVAVEANGGERGSLVMFSVGPQHQTCRTWAAWTADGKLVRVLTDLGLLELDPTAGRIPWY
jgi:hypothetical protein